MAVHVARIGLVHINSVGQAKSHVEMTIGEAATSSSELRVLADAANTNTAGFPTTDTYLALEDVGGFSLIHLDQTYVITSSVADVEIGSVNVMNAADAVINPSTEEKQDEIIASLPDTSGLTYSTVLITEAVAGIADLGVGAAGEVVRLHALYVTARAICTVTVSSDDNGDGTGDPPVVLSGPWTFGSGGGIAIPFNSDPSGALATPAVKHMTVTFAINGGDGYAVISKGPA